MKITGTKLCPEDEPETRKSNFGTVSKDRTGLATGAAAKIEKQREKRNSLTPDAERMAAHLESLIGRETGRIGADRDRWNELAKKYPGEKGIKLVDAAFQDRAKMEFKDWAGVALNSAKIRWYATNRFEVSVTGSSRKIIDWSKANGA